MPGRRRLEREKTALPHKLYQPLLPLQPLRGSTLGFWGASGLRLHTLVPLRKHTRGLFGANDPAVLPPSGGHCWSPPPQGPSSHPGNIAVLTLPTERGQGPAWPTPMAPRASPREHSRTGQTPAVCLGHRFERFFTQRTSIGNQGCKPDLCYPILVVSPFIRHGDQPNPCQALCSGAPGPERCPQTPGAHKANSRVISSISHPASLPRGCHGLTSPLGRSTRQRTALRQSPHVTPRHSDRKHTPEPWSATPPPAGSPPALPLSFS